MKRIITFLMICLLFVSSSVSISAYEGNNETSKFYSQEFCDALTNYLKNLGEGTYSLYCWGPSGNFTVDSLKANDSIITLYEETEDLIIFNIKGMLAAPGIDIINGYKFTTTSLFAQAYKNETDCGHCVYKDGKIYGIIKAVQNGIITVEHLAEVIPNVQKTGTSNEPVTVQPATAAPETKAPVPTFKKLTPAKRLNPMKVTAKAKTVKAKKLKKSKVTVSAITVKNAKGKVTYKKLSGSKKLTVTKKGKITVKKGTKKGTYKLKVKITAKGNSKYLEKSVTKTVKVKVK